MKKFYSLFVMVFIAIAVNAQVSFAPRFSFGQQELKLDVTPVEHGERIPSIRNLAPKKAGTLVTPPLGATAKAYTLEGIYSAWDGNEWVTVSDASPADAKVIIINSDIYVQGVSYWFPEGWIKGTISGSTATFAYGQFVGKDQYGDNFINGYNGDICNITFDYDSTTGELGLTGCFIMESPYTNAGSDCFGYWSSLTLTPKDLPEPEIVTPPSSLVTEEWELIASNVNFNEEEEEPTYSPISYTVNVGFEGENVYIQGINPLIGEAWIKGSRSGQTATFKTGQYLGVVIEDGVQKPMYLLGFTIGVGITDIAFNLNSTADQMTMNVDYAIINAKKMALSYYEIITNIVLTKNSTNGISTIKSEKKDGAIYSIDGCLLNEVPTSGLYIQNGKKYMVK